MKKTKLLLTILLSFSMVIGLCACGGDDPIVTTQPVTETSEVTTEATEASTETTEATTEATEVTTEAEPTTEATTEDDNPYVVCIDPGHQKKADTSKEPIGPGASEKKMKVTDGACGNTTGYEEKVFNLEVGLKLQKLLEERGYTVIMTRTTQDVNISNSERAAIANDADADAFIRIHADSADSSKAHGISCICQTPKNKYNGKLYKKSRALSDAVLDHVIEETGAHKRGVTEEDNMSGINWCSVPVTIIECGFLSNKEDELNLQDPDYQDKLAKGMADGIDAFLGR